MASATTWIAAAGDGCELTVKATPRAARNQIAGVEEGWLRVRVQAPPVDGKANAALVAFLAETLALPKRSVRIVGGETARVKKVRVCGLDAGAARARLGLA
jgi:uncharacterized protein (TIGR00251 family)